MDEGYIKFNAECVSEKPVNSDMAADIINKWRARLYDISLIGMLENGMGFGNISMRTGDGKGFIISGSAIGNTRILKRKQYAKIVDFDFERNYVKFEGVIMPSSESLSHAAVYTADEEVHAVIHIHNQKMWNTLFGIIPTTSMNAQYGTKELAYEIIELFSSGKVKKTDMFVMGGHKNGLMSFGRDIKSAVGIIMKYLR